MNFIQWCVVVLNANSNCYIKWCVSSSKRTDCDNVTVLFGLLGVVCVVTCYLAFEHYNWYYVNHLVIEYCCNCCFACIWCLVCIHMICYDVNTCSYRKYYILLLWKLNVMSFVCRYYDVYICYIVIVILVMICLWWCRYCDIHCNVYYDVYVCLYHICMLL